MKKVQAVNTHENTPTHYTHVHAHHTHSHTHIHSHIHTHLPNACSFLVNLSTLMCNWLSTKFLINLFLRTSYRKYSLTKIMASFFLIDNTGWFTQFIVVQEKGT